jgi:TonB-dependent starch-binding outer membrane protein SusC
MALPRHLVVTLVGCLVLATGLSAQTPTGAITGRVVDSTAQQPIPSVNVIVEGTRLGGQTRDDGSFTVGGVPAGTHTVRATRIGYAPQTQQVTVTAGGTVTVNFAMSRQAAVLSEVVVTGYGTQRREAISGSVATVDAEAANVGVISNATQMLQGRVAGVHMTANNGEPGGGAQIRIRGGTSLSASNEPLYVVDGVPLQNETPVAGARNVGNIEPALPRSPLNSINPNDIQSITVLKDASATAIYGSRGANGVILIETKRGAAAGAGVLEYDTYVAASTAARTLDLATADQYRSFVQQQVTLGNACRAETPPRTCGLPATALNDLGTATTNWQDELNRTGYATNHNLSFSGGSQSTQYRASLNLFDQKGVVIANGLRRYQGRLNGQHQAFDGRLQLGLNLTASRVDNDYLPFENGGGFEGGVFTNMAVFNPTRPVRITDPSTGLTAFYEIGPGAQSVRNPVALAEQVIDEAPESRVLGNVTGSFSVLPSLTARTTFGVDYTDALRQTYFPRANAIGAAFNGLARQAQRNLQNINFQQLLTFTPEISSSQELEVLGGYEFTEVDNSGFEVVMTNFVTDVFRWDNLGAGSQSASPIPTSYREESRLVSFFSRANYNFGRRYFLTGVVRYDGSSRLAEGNKWSVFPAISASWRVSEEGFMRDRPFSMSTLGLRAGWGLQGNQAVRPYATQLLLRTSNDARYPFGTGVTTGLLATQVANPDLKWETAEQINLGIDYGFRDDRFTGVIDFYQKDTKDLLLDVTVPQPAVVATRVENIGSIRNTGMEATFNAALISRPSRTLGAELVFSIERNKVVEIGGDRTFIITGAVNGQGQSGRFAQRIIKGEPLGTFWGPRFIRVSATGEQLFQCDRTDADCVNGETSDPRGDDEGIIGNANPDFSLGLSNNATWNKFDLSWLWRAEIGRDVFNNTALVYQTKGSVKQGRNFLADALTDPDGLDEPAIYSSRWIESGSFVRLQNVTVGYNFNLPGRFGSRSTRVFLSGDNLALFTGYSGYDPEVFVDRGLASRGIDYLVYPRARTFTAGARVQF